MEVKLVRKTGTKNNLRWSQSVKTLIKGWPGSELKSLARCLKENFSRLSWLPRQNKKRFSQCFRVSVSARTQSANFINTTLYKIIFKNNCSSVLLQCAIRFESFATSPNLKFWLYYVMRRTENKPHVEKPQQLTTLPFWQNGDVIWLRAVYFQDSCKCEVRGLCSVGNVISGR